MIAAKDPSAPDAPAASATPPPPLYGVANPSPSPVSDEPIMGYHIEHGGGEKPLLDGSASAGKLSLNPTTAWSLTLLGSAAVLAQSAMSCCPNGEVKYAVSVGAISLAICLFYFLAVKPGSVVLDETAEFGMYLFLCLWWGIAAMVLTFDGPYLITSNGYFGCWAAAIGSSYLFYSKGGKFKELCDRYAAYHEGARTLSILLIASIVELLAALFALPGNGKTKFALAAGVVSIFAVLVLMFVNTIDDNAKRLVHGFLMVWWGCGVAVCTFPSSGPFLVTGNGYFGTWIAAFASTKLFFSTGGEGN